MKYNKRKNRYQIDASSPSINTLLFLIALLKNICLLILSFISFLTSSGDFTSITGPKDRSRIIISVSFFSSYFSETLHSLVSSSNTDSFSSSGKIFGRNSYGRPEAEKCCTWNFHPCFKTKKSGSHISVGTGYINYNSMKYCLRADQGRMPL